jgi:hypothetical protein
MPPAYPAARVREGQPLKEVPMPPEDPPLPPAKALKDDLTFALRDRNDDAGLTEAEFERGRGVTERLKDPGERYDTNGDGRVDRAEWQAGRAADRGEGPPDEG